MLDVRIENNMLHVDAEHGVFFEGKGVSFEGTDGKVLKIDVTVSDLKAPVFFLNAPVFYDLQDYFNTIAHDIKYNIIFCDEYGEEHRKHYGNQQPPQHHSAAAATTGVRMPPTCRH